MKKLWNLFNKNKTQPEKSSESPQKEDSKPDNLIAALTFTIDNNKEVFLDIQVEDFEDKSVEGLAELISHISTIQCQLVTMQMCQQAFADDDAIEQFTKLVTIITQNQQEYQQSMVKYLEDSMEEPCIKPSDML